MNITTLGTSHGDPTLEHFCTSTLLETQGRYYLIDAGEPANALLVRQGLRSAQLSAIFITHMHIDHTGSLPVVCEQADKYRRNFPELFLTVCLPEQEAIEPLHAWRRANHNRFNNPSNVFRHYDQDNGYQDEALAMTAVRTRHLNIKDEPNAASYAIKIAAEGKNVLFTGDLASDFGDFPLEQAQHCDLVFSEITHYPLEMAIPTLEKLNCGKLVFYHIHNPWQTEEGRNKVLQACSHLPYPVEFAFDGYKTSI